MKFIPRLSFHLNFCPKPNFLPQNFSFLLNSDQLQESLSVLKSDKKVQFVRSPRDLIKSRPVFLRILFKEFNSSLNFTNSNPGSPTTIDLKHNFVIALFFLNQSIVISVFSQESRELHQFYKVILHQRRKLQANYLIFLQCQFQSENSLKWC